MATLLKDKVVKCRKEHPCFWCGERIPIGSNASTVAFVDDGDLISYHTHLECRKAADGMDFYDGEGVCEASMYRGSDQPKY
jgi:hypothetical protein